MEFRGIPDSLLDFPITRFALWDDAEIDALHARALSGDSDAINRLYLALVAHLAGNGAQRSTAAIERFKVKQQRRRGGKAKAAKLRKAKQQGTAPDSWMVPLFEEAHRLLATKHRARIGRKALVDKAKQVAAAHGIDPDRRDLLKPHHAQRFLDDLKSR